MAQARPPFRYARQEAILRRLAAANGLTYEEVLDAAPGSVGARLRREGIELAANGATLGRPDLQLVHSGGLTDAPGLRDDEVPVFVSRAHVVGDPWYHGATGPLEFERPQAMPNLLSKLARVPLLGKIGFVLLFIISWLPILLPVFLLLTGCTTVPEATRPPECIACIGPYDIGLTSHREALN